MVGHGCQGVRQDERLLAVVQEVRSPCRRMMERHHMIQSLWYDPLVDPSARQVFIVRDVS